MTQYDIEPYQRLETLLKMKLPQFPCDESTVLVLLERVSEAQRIASREFREMQQSQNPKNKKRRRRENGPSAGDGEGGDDGGNEQESAAKAGSHKKKNHSKRRK